MVNVASSRVYNERKLRLTRIKREDAEYNAKTVH